jgi:hypothetical protein
MQFFFLPALRARECLILFYFLVATDPNFLCVREGWIPLSPSQIFFSLARAHVCFIPVWFVYPLVPIFLLARASRSWVLDFVRFRCRHPVQYFFTPTAAWFSCPEQSNFSSRSCFARECLLQLNTVETAGSIFLCDQPLIVVAYDLFARRIFSSFVVSTAQFFSRGSAYICYIS